MVYDMVQYPLNILEKVLLCLVKVLADIGVANLFGSAWHGYLGTIPPTS